MNGLSRQSPSQSMDGLSRLRSDDLNYSHYDSMNRTDYIDIDDPELALLSDEELDYFAALADDTEAMNGLSRIETMSDDELDETLGLFGKGGRKRRKARRKARKAARKAKRMARKAKRKAKRAGKKAKRARKRRGRKERRGKAARGIGKFFENIFGGGRREDEEDEEDYPEEDYPEEDLRDDILDPGLRREKPPWKERKFLGLKNPAALGVYGGGTLLAVGGIILLARKRRKKPRKKRAA